MEKWIGQNSIPLQLQLDLNYRSTPVIHFKMSLTITRPRQSIRSINLCKGGIHWIAFEVYPLLLEEHYQL